MHNFVYSVDAPLTAATPGDADNNSKNNENGLGAKYTGTKPRIAGFLKQGARLGPPEGVDTLIDNLAHAAKVAGGDSPFLGHRMIKSDGNLGEYVWESYNQVSQRATNFGAGLVQMGIKTGSCIGLYSINRPEWILGEQACYRHDFPIVPLYDTLGEKSMLYIMEQTEMVAVICTADKKDAVLRFAPKLKNLRMIIIMDGKPCGADSIVLPVVAEVPKIGDSDGDGEAKQQEGTDTGADTNTKKIYARPISVQSFLDIEELGMTNPFALVPGAVNPESVATICYTSGTTGMPKGVVLTHKNILAAAGMLFTISQAGRFPNLTPEDIHISYLPLAHVFERVGIQFFMFSGCRVGFYSGNVQALKLDMQVLRPTIFVSVPRLLNRVYEGVIEKVKAGPGVKRAMFDMAFKSKKAALKRCAVTHLLWDALVFKKVREFFGGSVRLIFSGSAPLSSHVADFLRICFSCPVFEGYGQTETASGISVVIGPDTVPGHVGAPLPGSEIMLVDTPELGYASTDEPYPRGEIYVRGPQMFREYYKLPEKTAEVKKPGGWVATGDIGMWGEGGRLVIIDRAKSVFKLAQGEFIAPETIEETYKSHNLVQSVFVYGDPSRASVVAIIYPEPRAFSAWKQDAGLQSAQPNVVASKLAEHLAQHGRKAGLKGYEVASAIHLADEDFTLVEENKTPTWKLRRDVVTNAFGPVIDRLYQSIQSGAGGGATGSSGSNKKLNKK